VWTVSYAAKRRPRLLGFLRMAILNREGLLTSATRPSYCGHVLYARGNGLRLSVLECQHLTMGTN
jgi:hypothetical protein